MGLFDDISMGLGLKDKDDAYRERTAETISKNQGSEAADRYRESQGIGSGAAAGLTFGNTPVGDLASNQVQNAAPTELRSYGANPSFFGDLNKDRQIGYRAMVADMSGQPLLPFGDVTADDIKRYRERTEFAKTRADQNFMGTGLTQQEYARGQQYGFSTGSDGQMTARTSDRGPAPTITDPNAPDPTDPESTTFNPNNAFLRNRMRMQQEQGGGILPPAGAEPPITGGPVPQIPEPNIDMPMLPSPQPRPQMPPQLQGIMGLSDRSNISPAMRYAAENYYRLGGRQMMNDEFERGRTMIQGQSV